MGARQYCPKIPRVPGTLGTWQTQALICISNYLYENLLCTSYISTKLKDLVKIYADEIDIAPSEKNSIHCDIKGPSAHKRKLFLMHFPYCAVWIHPKWEIAAFEIGHLSLFCTVYTILNYILNSCSPCLIFLLFPWSADKNTADYCPFIYILWLLCTLGHSRKLHSLKHCRHAQNFQIRTSLSSSFVHERCFALKTI